MGLLLQDGYLAALASNKLLLKIKTKIKNKWQQTAIRNILTNS